MEKNCSKCVMDHTDPLLRLNDDGICQYCILQARLEEQYPLGQRGEEMLAEQIANMKAAGKGKAYDCIIGVSGGTDSTYQLHLAKKFG